MDLSQLKLYIEVETMTHCYVCDNFQKSIFIRSAKVKEGFLYFIDVKETYWFAKSGIRTMYMIYIFAKLIQLESINHAL